MITSRIRNKSGSIYMYFARQRSISKVEENTNNEIINFTEEEDDNIKINCDKSGLLQQHRNVLHGQMPYSTPSSWIHQTEKYQRKVFGRFGTKSGVDPRICYPRKSALESVALYEKLCEPQSLPSVIMKSKLEEQHKIEEVRKREEYVMKNMEKLEQWKDDLHKKVMKKEADALAVKQRKERLVEEVRRHFGYKVDPRDERFKEVLEQKEREDKKMQKEAKRQAKEQKLMSKLVGKSP